MDLVPYVAAAQDYFHSHPTMDCTVALMAGAIASHPMTCADVVFKIIVNTPLKHVVIWNWPKISEWIDAAQKRFGQDVAAEQEAEEPVIKKSDAPEGGASKTA